MRSFIRILTAGVSLACVATLQARAEGWYVGAELGANKASDFELEGGGQSLKSEFDWGYGAAGQVGYGFGPVRVETELGWRTNGFDKVGGLGASGDADLWTAMGNVYYDIGTGTAFTPFLGAGVGVGYLEVDNARNSAGTGFAGSDTVLAYQGIAGVSYRLDDQVSLKTAYKYIGTTESKFNSGNSTLEDNYNVHSVTVGFNYNFGAKPKPAPEPVKAQAPAPRPTPPAPPAPAPKPAPIVSNYQVFFDFDRADVTTDAASVIQNAAATVKQGGRARVELTGHADRSGSDKYNMALSMKRAEAVKAALVRQGIPADSITVAAKGESSPLVPTADGVREPQNRRVEIVLQ